MRHLNNHHDIRGVLTRPDALVGRKRQLTPSAVAQAANELGIETLKTNRPDRSSAAWLNSLGVDACVVVAYGALLSSEVLNASPPFLNVHFSLLPQYRGAAPVQAAIANGDAETGVTVFRIDEGMDTGPILGHLTHRLGGDEKASELLETLASLSLPLLDEVLARPLIGVPQSGKPTKAPKLSKTNGHITKKHTLVEVSRMVRAYAEEPGAWLDTTIGPIKLHECQLTIDSGQPNLSPDTMPPDTMPTDSHELVLSFDELGPYLATRDSNTILRLTQVQQPGKGIMSGVEWQRGLREPVKIV